MGVSGCGNNNGKTLVLLACFLLLLAFSPFLHGVGCFAAAEATSPEEAAEQTLMVGSTPALETAAPQQHRHGQGSGASAISSNAAGGLWSAELKPTVARRLPPEGAVDGAGHSCGSSGRQGCTPSP